MPTAVDWAFAERVARRLAGREPFADSYHASSLEPDFVELTPVAEELVRAETGLASRAGPARAKVLDRAEWISANVASFRRLLSPLLERLEERTSGRRGGSLAVTGKVTGAQLGALLGWMSHRVLGQYDVLVVDDETALDQDLVYYVGPNLLSLEKRYAFAPREFRLWIALHEVTHRVQFTGVPWLRGYFLGLVHEALGLVDPDPSHVKAVLRRALSSARQRRDALADGGLVHLLATPEQRAVLDRLGGLMALLEGHGDVVMDRAAAGRVPSSERFSRVLRERRRSATGPTRLIQRLLGIEAKLAQYEQGERFIAAIEAAEGPRAVDRCWESPDHLPTLAEIRAPELWLARTASALVV
jgi:coenzyme F420 biosynthesis associated uncharacterized protein